MRRSPASPSIPTAAGASMPSMPPTSTWRRARPPTWSSPTRSPMAWRHRHRDADHHADRHQRRAGGGRRHKSGNRGQPDHRHVATNDSDVDDGATLSYALSARRRRPHPQSQRQLQLRCRRMRPTSTWRRARPPTWSPTTRHRRAWRDRYRDADHHPDRHQRRAGGGGRPSRATRTAPSAARRDQRQRRR